MLEFLEMYFIARDAGNGPALALVIAVADAWASLFF